MAKLRRSGQKPQTPGMGWRTFWLVNHTRFYVEQFCGQSWSGVRCNRGHLTVPCSHVDPLLKGSKNEQPTHPSHHLLWACMHNIAKIYAKNWWQLVVVVFWFVLYLTLWLGEGTQLVYLYICIYVHIEVGTMLVHNDFRYQITLVRGFYCSMYFTCCLLLSSLPSSVFCPPSRSCLLLPA